MYVRVYTNKEALLQAPPSDMAADDATSIKLTCFIATFCNIRRKYTELF